MGSQNADSQYLANPAGLPTSADHDGEQLKVNRELEEQIRKLPQKDRDQIIKLCISIRQREIRKEPSGVYLANKEVLELVNDSLEYLHQLSRVDIYYQRQQESEIHVFQRASEEEFIQIAKDGGQLLISIFRDPKSVPQKFQAAISAWNNSGHSSNFSLNVSILIDISLERKKQILLIVGLLNKILSSYQDLQQGDQEFTELKKAIGIVQEDLSSFRSEILLSKSRTSQV